MCGLSLLIAAVELLTPVTLNKAGRVVENPPEIRAFANLEKGSPRPDDFDAFWAEARSRLAAEVALDPKVELVEERSGPAWKFYRISFATFGRRVYGYMSVPTDRALAPYPIEFQVSAAGFGEWSNDMEPAADRIVVFFSVYDWAPDWNWLINGLQSRYDAMNADYEKRYNCKRYCTAGITESREEYYFYPVLLGINRAVDWLCAREDVDHKRVWYEGTSQGGGFGFYLCGLNHHFTRAVFFVPAITDTMGYLKGRESGWPKIVESNSSTPEKRAAAERNAPYFDAANFASLITCPVRVVAGLSDTTCPPSAVTAAFNEIKSEDKRIIYGQDMPHGCYDNVYYVLGNWLRGVTNSGAWCYKPGECEAWQLKLCVEESSAALCKVGWPGKYVYPTQEPECFWSEIPVEGYDFIPGDKKSPPHRCVRKAVEVPFTYQEGLYDLGREELGYVYCRTGLKLEDSAELNGYSTGERPKLFVGETAGEAWDSDWNNFEQVTVMDEDPNGAPRCDWRSRHPLALRYFRFDCSNSVQSVRFVSEVDRSEPKIKYLAPNERAAKIYNAALDTLRLNSRTFLLDGPKRDRLPWMGDFVVSCLADAYSLADAEVARRSLVAVGTPSSYGHVNGIGPFTLWWIIGHDLVQRYFPDGRFLTLHFPRIKERVEALEKNEDERGYFAKDLGWCFMDWTDSDSGQLHSEVTLQVIYFAALKSAANLARQLGERELMKKWNAKAEGLKAKLLASGMDNTRHARALAIIFDLVTGEEAKKFAHEIATLDLPPTMTPYMSTMEVWALMKGGETSAAKCKFESVWGAMIDRGATTFWEGYDSHERDGKEYVFYGRKFGKSLCHAWSSGPVFLLQMYPELGRTAAER